MCTLVIDTDECQSEPCLNDGRCIDEIGSYKCECQGGYSGVNCGIGN